MCEASRKAHLFPEQDPAKPRRLMLAQTHLGGRCLHKLSPLGVLRVLGQSSTDPIGTNNELRVATLPLGRATGNLPLVIGRVVRIQSKDPRSVHLPADFLSDCKFHGVGLCLEPPTPFCKGMRLRG